jgi:hypothetical protein
MINGLSVDGWQWSVVSCPWSVDFKIGASPGVQRTTGGRTLFFELVKNREISSTNTERKRYISTAKKKLNQERNKLARWSCVLVILSVLAPSHVFAADELADATDLPGRELRRARAVSAPKREPKNEPERAPVDADDDGKPQVRIVGMKTDAAKRYAWIIPPFPVPPFNGWRKWFKEHEESVHCSLEWRDDEGKWWHGELRSTHFDPNSEDYRVGYGEFPGIAYDAYGIYIIPGRLPRDVDREGRKIEITIDEKIGCDYRNIEAQVRNYGRKDARSGQAGTGGRGKRNVGLGGPAYKPTQNSNTMVNYILKQCGINRPAPDKAIGWDREPRFPYSTDAETFPRDDGD